MTTDETRMKPREDNDCIRQHVLSGEVIWQNTLDEILLRRKVQKEYEDSLPTDHAAAASEALRYLSSNYADLPDGLYEAKKCICHC